MFKFLITGLAFGLLMLMGAGCGDDDKATGPTKATPLGYAKGQIILVPHTGMQLEIFGNGAVTPNLDSIRVGDSLVNELEWSMESDLMFADAYWEIPFSEDGDALTFMYDPGDTAVIDVWGEGRSSTCRVKLLNPAQSEAEIISPAWFADTITPDESDTVYWHKVEQADYYAIMMPCAHYSGPWIFSYYCATDTFFIITGDMLPDSVVQCDVVVSPFNGPDPRTDQTNWTGNLLDGVVYSAGGHGYTSIIIGSPPPSPAGTASHIQPEHANWNGQAIVAKVYEKYRTPKDLRKGDFQ